MTRASVNSGPLLIIANPTSGRGRGLRTAKAVTEILRSHGVDVEVHHTAASGDAERIAKEAIAGAPQPPQCIVACGGDGTVQEIANALADARPSLGDACPVLGLAPSGRCNDFARAFDIPTDPAVIADVLLNGRPMPTDLGRVNGRYFCTVAAAGVDAEVSSFVDTMRMPLRGTLAYLYGAIRVLIRYQPYDMTITGDFEVGNGECRMRKIEMGLKSAKSSRVDSVNSIFDIRHSTLDSGVIDRPMLLATTANTSCYGGAIRIAPDARPDDGRLDLCVVDRVSRLRAIALIPSLLAGTHGRCPAVHFLRTQRFIIESPHPLEIWADGERIARTPATIEAVPGAVRVLRCM